jgi:hypothetical protein
VFPEEITTTRKTTTAKGLEPVFFAFATNERIKPNTEKLYFKID